MKAVVVHQYGGPEVLKFEEYPDPVPGPGEVLVRVAATSVNPIDYKRRAGLTKDFYPIKFPRPGWRITQSATLAGGRRSQNTSSSAMISEW
jgi:NADPH:quinone reductase-like Zn-dependent oxidoreductase